MAVTGKFVTLLPLKKRFVTYIVTIGNFNKNAVTTIVISFNKIN